MLDINYIRENLELVKQAAKNKNREVDWETLLKLDDRRRELIGKVEVLRAERNVISSKKQEISDKRGKEIKQELKDIEGELRSVEDQFGLLMLTVPNVPHESVPVGKDASGNKEIKTWGKVPKFNFEPKDHIELAKALDLMDLERGAKVGGFRAYFLKNEAAQMELAIMWYTLNKLVGKGYTPLIAPSLVREFTLVGNGQFPWGREEVYHLQKDDLYLAGTAEVPVTAYFSDEVLQEKNLPKKFVAFSPCFRREAGSYGKDTKGLYRLHQFNKIEQVIISTNDLNNSLTLHEELLANAEEILQDLELPYRVLLMCTGDMGEPQVKKYDVETWMPGREAYGETMSNSIMGDFQARRLKIRYKAKEGKTMYCHTLNNTAIASPRILIAILENYQQADGSIKVPKVLQPFLGKKEIRR
ncbi:MAG: Serine-tRNA ligase [Candidatus Gottesmanbacteria bacterium GW2011_GWA2_47_9]|uniref:Serine--tRNA ligase n=2 Tax=Candidatus Gottesmaniibacteriota TaxID=1752720 RepID=A0A0G1WXZ3_9BACT|nr:MAG: Serine-tRNA ligase [Candidatus Gottesmanbacteria bacterium GW2011_GWA2_47_9]KKU95183.1 MAG: Serine-tRNA ligase [Candidatus Gottesmanbacteria bacterium GW2011_GWA1_48_13]